MNTQDTILQGLLNNTTVGQTDITKHMLLLWAQALEPSIKAVSYTHLTLPTT